MSRPRILVIEDDRGLTRALANDFQRAGYTVSVAHDGREGLRKARILLPDVIVLDPRLPGMSGLDVCRALRGGERTRSVPILLFAAQAEEADQFVGFLMGADDYVTQPISTRVLLQRIKALRRRAEGQAEPGDVVESQGVRIDRVRYQATVGGKPVRLTPTEFRLLECLLRQPGRAFTRQQLMEAAIREGSTVLKTNIDVHIKSLRRKLGSTALIETVHSVGYRFRDAAPE